MIQGFDFEIHYVKGSTHTVADSLSRRDYPECTDGTMDKLHQDKIIHTIAPRTGGGSGCVGALRDNIYDKVGNLNERVSDLLIKRLSYLILPGSKREDITVNSEGGIKLRDVCEWFTEDSGPMFDEADIVAAVESWMGNKLYVLKGIIYAHRIPQIKGEGFSLPPQGAINVIDSRMGEEVINRERGSMTLNAVAAEFRPAVTNSSRCQQFLAGMGNGSRGSALLTRRSDLHEGGLTDNTRTAISKRISYLLRHAASAEKVAMSPQAFVKITDLIEWLLLDMKIEVTMDNIKHIVELDLKGRFKVANGQICAVNGHSLSLPLMTFAPYNHKIAGHSRWLVHETYIKYLPSILKEGLSRMARNHVHFSIQPGKAGFQRKNKPTIAVYVDVEKALERGLAFQHCENDVIMCSGDKNGLISPYFFERIQNTLTGALIEFDRPAAPLREDMIRLAVDKEVELPPP